MVKYTIVDTEEEITTEKFSEMTGIDVWEEANEDTITKYGEENGYVHKVSIHFDKDTPSQKRSAMSTEHSHPEDALRLLVDGEALVHFRALDDTMIKMIWTPGVMIRVPADNHHTLEIPNEEGSFDLIAMFVNEPSEWKTIPRNSSNSE